MVGRKSRDGIPRARWDGRRRSRSGALAGKARASWLYRRNRRLIDFNWASDIVPRGVVCPLYI
jgi:hypothetical protein